MNAIDAALTAPSNIEFSWTVAIVRLSAVALPLALLAAAILS